VDVALPATRTITESRPLRRDGQTLGLAGRHFLPRDLAVHPHVAAERVVGPPPTAREAAVFDSITHSACDIRLPEVTAVLAGEELPAHILCAAILGGMGSAHRTAVNGAREQVVICVFAIAMRDE